MYFMSGAFKGPEYHWSMTKNTLDFEDIFVFSICHNIASAREWSFYIHKNMKYFFNPPTRIETSPFSGCIVGYCCCRTPDSQGSLLMR